MILYTNNVVTHLCLALISKPLEILRHTGEPKWRYRNCGSIRRRVWKMTLLVIIIASTLLLGNTSIKGNGRKMFFGNQTPQDDVSENVHYWYSRERISVQKSEPRTILCRVEAEPTGCTPRTIGNRKQPVHYPTIFD
jgi:hypothetical protein